MRAAAAAVLAGYQVAVVAPTTVLVRQHVRGFASRFAEIGIEVAHLSRLVPEHEAEAVRAGLADGRIRLVVGTHALAAEAVRFADLGLLIVDEEQRFGIAHKTAIRGLGAGVACADPDGDAHPPDPPVRHGRAAGSQPDADAARPAAADPDPGDAVRCRHPARCPPAGEGARRSELRRGAPHRRSRAARGRYRGPRHRPRGPGRTRAHGRGDGRRRHDGFRDGRWRRAARDQHHRERPRRAAGQHDGGVRGGTLRAGPASSAARPGRARTPAGLLLPHDLGRARGCGSHGTPSRDANPPRQARQRLSRSARRTSTPAAGATSPARTRPATCT